MRVEISNSAPGTGAFASGLTPHSFDGTSAGASSLVFARVGLSIAPAMAHIHCRPFGVSPARQNSVDEYCSSRGEIGFGITRDLGSHCNCLGWPVHPGWKR